ncbi:MAG: type IV pilus twitching motility protein PilT [Acidobacteriota bacterium]
MAQIDQLLRACKDRKADALVFVAGERGQLVYGSESKPVVNQTLTAPQIRRLLSEVVDDAELAKIDAGQEGRFRYELVGVGVFVGRARTATGGLTVTVKPEGEAATPSAPGPEAAPIAEAAAEPALGEPIAGLPSDRYEIDRLFRAMVQRRASDIHICCGVHPMLRIDGNMRPMTDYPVVRSPDAERLLTSLMPERSKKQFDECNDTDFAYELPGVARFRCNVFRDRHGMGGVFRQIPARLMTAEELGLSKHILNLCFLSKGLVLVTGPTGSGKSTTLATLIDHINARRRDHIITIEDPIEFVHGNKGCLVNQREVGVHTSSFKHALRAALREDPDIVLVGEMRDLETIAIAIETAVTGHLVFGTLHTSTAVQTVDRIIDQFPADRQAQVRVMLADSLKGVIAQTLLRKKGGGRVAALEVLLGTQGTANLIREGKTYQLPSVMQTGRNVGMTVLNDVLVELVKRGVVEPQEAYTKASDKENLLGLFKRAEISDDFLKA